MMMNDFRTLYGKPITNLTEYISDYLVKNDNTEILIGADSQSYGHKYTRYGVVIALYSKGKGAHVLARTMNMPMQYDIQSKLINEVW